MEDYSGFIAGAFEEFLLTLEAGRPVYLLGGFGGATEVLAEAILAQGAARPEALTVSWHSAHNPRLVELLDARNQFTLPPDVRLTQDLLDALFTFVVRAREKPAETLQTGLSDEETREMLRTRSISTAVGLVKKGLESTKKLRSLPA